MSVTRILQLALLCALVLVAAVGCSKKPMTDPAGTGGGGYDPALDAARSLSESERVILDEKVYFAFDSYELNAAAQAVLQRKAQLIRSKPTLKVLIEGHCDERGTQEYNIALGNRRAQASQRYLLNMGVPAMQLETISYGEERPAAVGHNENAWAQNRRDEFKAVWGAIQ
ncbi:peptidoglycan-associated lipoprotein Pal [Megalodesulfovibrio gigas]|uniref:Peptidoglycan-associated lipoprotein n=1 Tax=Megalodesulfovibrio gigas (strain ATCC 19364 / DSM 1382 / NCIMB 9332 / VKM B-1759) TaxID=1121448 RepID=T2GE63_MEGG1|nr:peptidoglycan-associated lipoprotein Pal [Megalodesulfovibrio gigas]AGW14890.1 putative peptidoglycan-associated lipoprotein [Megalodesulfovibrio gigas DSM 1382 = ATCC 19364]